MSNRMNSSPVQRWAEAFRDGQRFVSAKYNVHTDGHSAYLHGHAVAWRDDAGIVWMSMCGWPTPTTRDRLDHIVAAFGLPWRFRQARSRQLYGAHEIDAWERVALCGPLTQLALQAEQRERDALRAAA